MRGIPTAGPLPDSLRTYRLVKLGVALPDILNAPALLLDDLLDIDAIYREAESDATSRGVDS